jgi:hypothetical protein
MAFRNFTLAIYTQTFSGRGRCARCRAAGLLAGGAAHTNEFAVRRQAFRRQGRWPPPRLAGDQCCHCCRGGGTVYFSPGRYLSASIRLKSNITLYLEAGAVIEAA